MAQIEMSLKERLGSQLSKAMKEKDAIRVVHA